MISIAQVVPDGFWSQSPHLAALLAVVAASLFYMDRQGQRTRDAQKEQDEDFKSYLEARDSILIQSMDAAISETRTNHQLLMDALSRNSTALEGMAVAMGPVIAMLNLHSMAENSRNANKQE